HHQSKQNEHHKQHKKYIHHVHITQQFHHDLVIDVHGKHFPAHLRLHAVKNERAHHVPEEPAKNQGEHDEQDVCDGRNKVASQLLLANDPDVFHCAASFTLAFSGGVCDCSPVSCRKISSRLTDAGRISLRSQPAATTARARSPRAKLPLRFSTSKVLPCGATSPARWSRPAGTSMK